MIHVDDDGVANGDDNDAMKMAMIMTVLLVMIKDDRDVSS